MDDLGFIIAAARGSRALPLDRGTHVPGFGRALEALAREETNESGGTAPNAPDPDGGLAETDLEALRSALASVVSEAEAGLDPEAPLSPAGLQRFEAGLDAAIEGVLADAGIPALLVASLAATLTASSGQVPSDGPEAATVIVAGRRAALASLFATPASNPGPDDRSQPGIAEQSGTDAGVDRGPVAPRQVAGGWLRTGSDIPAASGSDVADAIPPTPERDKAGGMVETGAAIPSPARSADGEPASRSTGGAQTAPSEQRRPIEAAGAPLLASGATAELTGAPAPADAANGPLAPGQQTRFTEMARLAETAPAPLPDMPTPEIGRSSEAPAGANAVAIPDPALSDAEMPTLTPIVPVSRRGVVLGASAYGAAGRAAPVRAFAPREAANDAAASGAPGAPGALRPVAALPQSAPSLVATGLASDRPVSGASSAMPGHGGTMTPAASATSLVAGNSAANAGALDTQGVAQPSAPVRATAAPAAGLIVDRSSDQGQVIGRGQDSGPLPREALVSGGLPAGLDAQTPRAANTSPESSLPGGPDAARVTMGRPDHPVSAPHAAPTTPRAEMASLPGAQTAAPATGGAPGATPAIVGAAPADTFDGPAPRGDAAPLPEPGVARATPAGAAAAPEARAAGPQQPALLASVVEHVRRSSVTAGRTRVEISTGGQGSLEIDLRADPSGQLKVVLRAENPALLNALRLDRGALIDALQQSGLDLGEAGLDFEGFGASRQDSDAQTGPAGPRGPAEEAEPAPRPAARPAPGFHGGSGRLDILT